MSETDGRAVTLRTGGVELLDLLEPLWLALHAHHQRVEPRYAYHPDNRSWQLRRACYREWLGEAGSFVLLAERAGQPIGYAFVHVRPGPDDTWVTGDRLAEVETLSVAPGERGRGVGTMMLDAIDERLEAQGIKDLIIAALVANSGARRLYERRGLRPLWVTLARFAEPPPARPEPHLEEGGEQGGEQGPEQGPEQN